MELNSLLCSAKPQHPSFIEHEDSILGWMCNSSIPSRQCAAHAQRPLTKTQLNPVEQLMVKLLKSKELDACERTPIKKSMPDPTTDSPSSVNNILDDSDATQDEPIQNRCDVGKKPRGRPRNSSRNEFIGLAESVGHTRKRKHAIQQNNEDIVETIVQEMKSDKASSSRSSETSNNRSKRARSKPTRDENSASDDDSGSEIDSADVPSPTTQRRFKCTYSECGKAFAQSNHLKAHLRLHTGEKPYQCDVSGCHRAFTQLGHLTAHTRVHTREKPFACDFADCHKRFSQSTNLTVHRRTHDVRIAKPHQCRIDGCGKMFSARSRLRLHIAKIHGVDVTTMDVTSWKLSDQELLTRGSHSRVAKPQLL
eukprot:c25768_g1_i1.p1 GENE.c25768_g1_i1~~c25768_g1_i1.p1  ORF type:complete len:366 (-),score=78.29 c25768_g1_i1:153-1250(-)